MFRSMFHVGGGAGGQLVEPMPSPRATTAEPPPLPPHRQTRSLPTLAPVPASSRFQYCVLLSHAARAATDVGDAGAGAAGGGLPRIPPADVEVGPRLSAEGATGVVHRGVYRCRSLLGVAVAEHALPVALKVRVWVCVSCAFRSVALQWLSVAWGQGQPEPCRPPLCSSVCTRRPRVSVGHAHVCARVEPNPTSLPLLLPCFRG
jgi:hypothetical protein